MEDLEKLFRGAERIKPRDAMWKSIAARAELAGAPAPERAFGLRLAASMAIALGALAALVMVARGPLRPDGPPASAGGAGEFSGGAVAVSAAAAPSAKEAELVDGDLLDWHADLGESGETGESYGTDETEWETEGYLLTADPGE